MDRGCSIEHFYSLNRVYRGTLCNSLCIRRKNRKTEMVYYFERVMMGIRKLLHRNVEGVSRDCAITWFLKRFRPTNVVNETKRNGIGKVRRNVSFLHASFFLNLSRVWNIRESS